MTPRPLRTIGRGAAPRALRAPRASFALLAFSALAACGVGACGGQKPPAPVQETQAKAIAPPQPTLRLPENARPVRYDLDLTLDPSKDDFAGAVGIDLTVQQPTTVIWLNARALRIREAHVTFGGKKSAARVLPGGDDFVGFAFDRPIGPGAARLDVAYEGHVDKDRQAGLYRVSEGRGNDDWYLYSVFEPIDARRAFPCFDEPAYKVPWKIALHVKKEHVALANAKVESETPGPNGMKTVVFEESKPLPSYLVALVVGPFDVLDAGTAGHHGTPLRFVVPKGRGGETRYATEVTTKLVGVLEDYFGMPYPYGKLDVAVVPRYAGTMEHPGLVALGQPITLIRPDEETPARKQFYAHIGGHELGHYWFGDYVTMTWWDDLWLNEAFTTWIDVKVTRAIDPSWNTDQGRLRLRGRAMGTDALATAQPIRVPITSDHDIANTFSADITYLKGAQVIRMFENFLGPEKFQSAVRRYMKEHAWKNATTDDFLAALQAETGQDIGPAFKTFIDQPGVPLVAADPICTKDAAPQLLVAQQRFIPTGSEASPDQSWQIPVCVKYGTKKGVTRECTLLRTSRSAITLDAEPSCPDWVLPNEGGAGYYRSNVNAAALSKLLKTAWPNLDPLEKIALVSDAAALTHNGTLGIAEALAFVPAMLKGADRHLIETTFEIVEQARKDVLRPELVPSYAKYIRSLYGEKAKALGWTSKPGEDNDTRVLRANVLRMVGDLGEDPAVRKKAYELVVKWLSDRKALEPDVLETALILAAKSKDRDLWNRLRQAARASHDRSERAMIFTALGNFRDSALMKETFDLLLSNEIEMRDGQGIVTAALAERESRDQAYEFLTKNFDTIATRTGRRDGNLLLRAAATYCDKEHHDEAVRFFTDRAKTIEGGPQILANALERQVLCIAQRERNEKPIEAFLKTIR
ncbi:M1 family metallopeptidase [Pendulispora albinea]|uniref:Aminopeptidase n=1 Tax=Pendulispora albinea TaxID=2741071 RepID=A0ABZ2LZP4_9BACT